MNDTVQPYAKQPWACKLALAKPVFGRYTGLSNKTRTGSRNEPNQTLAPYSDLFTTLSRGRQSSVSGGGGVKYGAGPTLAVYPEMKWYMACSVVSRLTGGSTPNASQHSRMMFLGWGPMQGMRALAMYSMGYDTRVFSVRALYTEREAGVSVWGRGVSGSNQV